MTITWYENEIVRIDCQYCQKKFQTRMQVNGNTKTRTCRVCKKIMHEAFPEGRNYTTEKMNAVIEKCQEIRYD